MLRLFIAVGVIWQIGPEHRLSCLGQEEKCPFGIFSDSQSFPKNASYAPLWFFSLLILAFFYYAWETLHVYKNSHY